MGLDGNPKFRGKADKVPFHLIPPRGLIAIAICFADGGFKYGPYNWQTERISASVYYGAILRHLFRWWCGEDRAPDGHHHLAHIGCCVLMLLDVDGSELFNDNRPPQAVPIGPAMDAAAAEIQVLRERDNTAHDLHDIPPRGF